MLIILMAIIAAGPAGHAVGNADFIWIPALGILNALLLQNCITKPSTLRSPKLRWATILFTALSVFISLILLFGSFHAPAGSFISPIMFVVSLLTIISGIVVIGDNSNTVKN
jgi:hypothetical protein